MLAIKLNKPCGRVEHVLEHVRIETALPYDMHATFSTHVLAMSTPMNCRLSTAVCLEPDEAILPGPPGHRLGYAFLCRLPQISCTHAGCILSYKVVGGIALVSYMERGLAATC